MLGRHGLEDYVKTSSSQCQESGGNEEMVNKMLGVGKVRFKGAGTVQPAKGKVVSRFSMSLKGEKGEERKGPFSMA